MPSIFRRKHLTLLSISLSLLILVSYITLSGSKKPTIKSNEKTVIGTQAMVSKLIDECQLPSIGEVNPLFPLVNSNNEKCIESKLLGLSIKEQIEIANGLLDTNLITYCHVTIHRLGVEAFKETQNIPQAIKLGSPGCLYGFYHGVLSTAGQYLTPEEIISQSQTLCRGLINPSQPLHNCAHAIGHGVSAATNFEMEKGIPYCEMLSDSFVAFHCLVGLLMEDFLFLRVKYSNGNFPDPYGVALCRETNRSLEFQKACVNMFYILILQEKFTENNGTQGLRDICNSFPNQEVKLECYHSLGTESAQFLGFDPVLIAKETCGTEINIYSLSCAKGAGLVYGMNFGFIKKQDYFCKLFIDQLSQACLSVTKEDIFTI